MRWRRGLRIVVIAAALASQGACFPAMLHGPRVEEGLSAMANVNVAAGPTHVEGDEGGIRQRNATWGGVGIGYGWRGEKRSGPSLFAGVYVPIIFPATQLDLFAQAPEAWTGPTAGGVGVNVALDHVAPYLQWGLINSSGDGWSVIQGISVRTDGGTQGGQLSWTPGVAAHIGGGRHRVHLYVMGAFGRLKACSFGSSQGSCAGERVNAFLAGATYEIVFRKPRGT